MCLRIFVSNSFVSSCVCTSVCVGAGVGIDLLTQKNGVETQRNNCTDTHARPVAIHRIEKRFFCKQKRIMINRKHDLSTNDGREQEEEGLNRKQKNKIFQEKWRERASGLQKNRYQRAEERCDFLASLLFFFVFFLFSRAGRVGVGGGANLFSVAHLIKSSRRIAMQRGRRGWRRWGAGPWWSGGCGEKLSEGGRLEPRQNCQDSNMVSLSLSLSFPSVLVGWFCFVFVFFCEKYCARAIIDHVSAICPIVFLLSVGVSFCIYSKNSQKIVRRNYWVGGGDTDNEWSLFMEKL